MGSEWAGQVPVLARFRLWPQAGRRACAGGPSARFGSERAPGRGFRPLRIPFGRGLSWRAEGVILRRSVGAWRSLVARFVRDEEVAGSNPVAPTICDVPISPARTKTCALLLKPNRPNDCCWGSTGEAQLRFTRALEATVVLTPGRPADRAGRTDRVSL